MTKAFDFIRALLELCNDELSIFTHSILAANTQTYE